LSAGEASAVPFEDWFLPGQAPAGRSRSVHPRGQYGRPVRVTFRNTGAGDDTESDRGDDDPPKRVVVWERT
jgi:hypothetical protein